MCKFYGLLLAGLMLLSAGAASAQQDVMVDITLDGYSGYIWRGGVIGADDKLVIQPGIGLTFGETGFSAGVWGSAFAQSRSEIIDATTGDQLDTTDEIDLWADYSTSLGEDSPVGISVGYTEYLLPSLNTGTKHTEEFYVGFSVDHPVSPSLTFYYDFGTVDAWYLTLSGGYDLPLGDGAGAPALSLGASAALSNYEKTTTTTTTTTTSTSTTTSTKKEVGLNDITGTASVSFAAGQATISPTIGVTYYDKVDSDNTSFWGGISIGFSFGGE